MTVGGQKLTDTMSALNWALNLKRLKMLKWMNKRTLNKEMKVSQKKTKILKGKIVVFANLIPINDFTPYYFRGKWRGGME